MTSAGSVKSSLVWNAVRTWGSRLAGFIIFFQLTRYLGPDQLGLFAGVFALISFLELIVDQGMSTAIIQRSSVEPRSLNSIFLLNLVSATVVFIGIFALREQISRLLGAEGISQIAPIAAVALIFNSGAMVQEALNRRSLHFKRLAARTLFSTAISGALGVWLAYQGFGVWALVAQFLCASVLNFAAIWWRPIWVPSFSQGFGDIKPYASVGLNTLGIRLLDYVATRGIDLIIGALLGVAALGVYSVGTKLQYIALQLVGTAIVDVAFPIWSRSKDDLQALVRQYVSTLKMAAAFSTPVWVGLFVLSQDLCMAAFGPRWHEASHVLSAMAVVGACQLLMQFDSALLTASGRPGFALFLTVARVVLPISMAVAFGQDDVKDFAWMIALGNVVLVPTSWLIVRIRLGRGLLDIIRAVLPQAGWGCITGYLLTTAMRGYVDDELTSVWLRLPVAGVLLVALYVPAVIMLVPEIRAEIKKRFFKY